MASFIIKLLIVSTLVMLYVAINAANPIMFLLGALGAVGGLYSALIVYAIKSIRDDGEE